jgi:F0F1-type ATP synthase membrane subunit c/vacuolar-type H+-ATPase subunit K
VECKSDPVGLALLAGLPQGIVDDPLTELICQNRRMGGQAMLLMNILNVAF